MTRRIVLIVALALALALPASASAGLATLQVRDLPLGGERSLASTRATAPFQLVGLHWQGRGTLELRTRAPGGAWSRWQAVAEDDGDAPDAGSPESRALRGWRASVPVWVGRAVGLEVRAIGRVTAARALTVRSPVSRVPLRVTAAAGLPQIVPRAAWQADESIRKEKPLYADTLRMAFVHHTAGTNTYTRAQAPAIVRAIELYHVKGNGWNDIGYNALVDRFGTVYEGRYGGIDRNVVGAHAKGFNTGSFGIAVMGDFRTVDPPAAAVDAVVRTLAWRLDLAHVDPLSTFNGISSGNERFGPGIPVFLRAISGHRDTGLTTCPGQRLYDLIPTIARRVAALGLPKLYAPAVVSDEAGGLRFTARLSSSLPWSVVVTDAAGNELGRGEGTGAAVDWAWLPSAPVPAGTQWRIESPGATPASGTLAATSTALQLTGATAVPSSVSPNGDGQADSTTVSFTLSADANVAVTLLDASGTTVGQAEAKRWRRAGPRTVVVSANGLADGAYVVRIAANATGGREATVDVPLTVVRTIGRVMLDPPAMTPNGDGHGDVLSVSIPLAAPAELTVRILRDGRWVATPFTGEVEAGTQTVTWDGRKRLGRAREGGYTVSVEALDVSGATARVELPFLLDATAPVVRIVSDAPPRLRVSEAAVLVIRANGARRVVRATGPGVFRIPRIDRLRTLVVTARDAAGNESTLRRGGVGGRPQ
jgi:flagellar hook assembly protein FlgD